MSQTIFREHQKKSFIMLSGFWPVREKGWGAGCVSELVKGKFMTKIFFQIMLNEVLKICEK